MPMTEPTETMAAGPEVKLPMAELIVPEPLRPLELPVEPRGDEPEPVAPLAYVLPPPELLPDEPVAPAVPPAPVAPLEP